MKVSVRVEERASRDLTGSPVVLKKFVEGEKVTLYAPVPIFGKIEFAVKFGEDEAYVITFKDAVDAILKAVITKKIRKETKRRMHGDVK
jgi:hypothetical protein